jgi:cytochrome P450
MTRPSSTTPYPTYSRLRSEAPVVHDTTWNLTFFTRYNDVDAILADRRFGRDIRGRVPAGTVDGELLSRIFPMDIPTWDGHHLAAGTKVGLLLGSANRDEGAFAGAQRFDVSRDARAHISLGRGIHHCVGAALAQLELEVAMEAIATLETMELDTDDLDRTPSLVFRGVNRLPLVVA